MKTYGKKNGFTTVELLTVIAILAILAGLFLGVAKNQRTRAHQRLAASTISVMVTAIEQFYIDNKEFPFIAEQQIGIDGDSTLLFTFNDPADTDDLLDTIAKKTGVEVVKLIGITEDDSRVREASIETLYFFLNRSPNSSKIIGAISSRFLTNKNGLDDEIELVFGSVSSYRTIPLIRVVDPWKNPFRYRYIAGNSFPVIVSAGPDGKFSTTYDNISSADL